jgi:hypothetical protein
VIPRGKPVPKLTDGRRDLLYDIAIILRHIKPNFDSRAKLLYSRDVFIRSIKVLFQYASVIVFSGGAQVTNTHNPFSAVIIHPPWLPV